MYSMFVKYSFSILSASNLEVTLHFHVSSFEKSRIGYCTVYHVKGSSKGCEWYKDLTHDITQSISQGRDTSHTTMCNLKAPLP